jgi:hypothetical protein
MRLRIGSTLLITCALGPLLLAQKGSVVSGFYPTNFHGDTFTGKVIDSNGGKGLALEYDHGSKQERFDGTIESACMAPIKDRGVKELRLSVIPKGTILTAFYSPRRQDKTTKTTVNYIVAICFDEVNGHRLNDPNRPIIPCSKPTAGYSAY